jgi:hypothetical protein
MDRKSFIKTVGITAAIDPITLNFCPYKSTNSFFSIRKIKDRHFLIDPDGEKFFSIGINHIDSASLRYQENISIWKNKYSNSMEVWLKSSVRTNLREWGFNSMGWNQEVVTGEATNHRHSRSFTPEEYKWLDIPYCHMLHFADFHSWENETINPDFFSKGFADWCDYVARDEVARLAMDPNLIGYFYIDCPTWIHNYPFNKWKGPLFDPEKLKTESGRKELFQMATQYYKTTSEAIRRYDKNHLIFGDRYEASHPLAVEVITAATPYTDAVCFQHFKSPEKVVENLNYWNKITGLPTLVADCCHYVRNQNTGVTSHTLDGYPEMYRLIKDTPSCIGYHLCGAYLENRVRKRGLLLENDNPDEAVVAMMKGVNFKMQEWVMKY